MLFSFFLYSLDHAADPVDRFWRSTRHMACFRARQSHCWHSPSRGLNPPQNTYFGEWKDFFKANANKLFLLNTKDHQVLIVGGLNMPVTNPRWPFGEKVKLPYLRHLESHKIVISHSQQQIDRPSRNLAQWCRIGLNHPDRWKFQFLKSKMADGHHFEKTLNCHCNCLTNFDVIWHADAELKS